MSIDINESTFIYAYEEMFYKRYQDYMCIKEFFRAINDILKSG